MINLGNKFGITENFMNSSWDPIFIFMITFPKLATFPLFAQRIVRDSGLIFRLSPNSFTNDSSMTFKAAPLSISMGVILFLHFPITKGLFTAVSVLRLGLVSLFVCCIVKQSSASLVSSVTIDDTFNFFCVLINLKVS